MLSGENFRLNLQGVFSCTYSKHSGLTTPFAFYPLNALTVHKNLQWDFVFNDVVLACYDSTECLAYYQNVHDYRISLIL